MRLVRLLVAMLVSLPLVLATTTSSASAASCYGAGCDDSGPQAQGCWNDRRKVAWTADNNLRLMYSPSCHAFWSWTDYGAAWWSTEVHIEMEHLEMVNANTQAWVFKRRLVTKVPIGSNGEWTNMLGTRNSDYRFRAVWADPAGGLPANFTPWARGGAQ
jgi:hypothetical protein